MPARSKSRTGGAGPRKTPRLGATGRSRTAGGLRATRPKPAPKPRTGSAKPRSRPQRRRRRSLGRRIAKWSFLAVLWLVVAGVGTIVYFAHDLPDVRQIAAPDLRPTLVIQDRQGQSLARYGDLRGETLSVDALPPHLIDAVLAIEDRRFYGHPGVDPIGIGRALWRNLSAGGVRQGGSTITQQLAKILFLSPERTLRRKVQEAILAFWLEATYTKDEILAGYLNRVYLGSGTYGMDAAARAYFGRSAEDVSVRQASVLAGLLRAPSRYSPAASPERALARGDVVLQAMVDAGSLTPAAAAAAGDAPLGRVATPGGPQRRYFTDWVVDMVPDYVGAGAGNVTVRTSFDPGLQAIVDAVAADHLADHPDLQIGVVVMTPSGAVRALLGGRDYDTSQFNRAVQALRQPGSAFKPIVYLAALEQGWRPDSPITDAPLTVAGWSPRNFAGEYLGETTLTPALARSANTAAVRLLNAVGVNPVRSLAREMGIEQELVGDLSLALGTSEVALMELTAAYAALANGGNGVWPTAIERITGPDGAVAYERFGGGPGPVVEPAVAGAMNRMLAAVLTQGTGRRAALDRPAAGKTGTTQDNRDAWFVGYTADYVAGVWIGRDDAGPMDDITGGTLPAEIWHDIMAQAHAGLPARPLPGTDLALPATAVASAGETDGIDDLLRQILDR